MINEQNNLDDRFETRRFDEGRPCGKPPCKSLVQRSRMLMQKRPLFNKTSPMTIIIITKNLLLIYNSKQLF